MSTTTLGAATTYRVDGAGWYSDGTGGTKRWGAYNTQNWVLRYTISVGSVPYKVSSFAWGSGTYTYYGDSNGYNKTPKYVIATAAQANNIQVADSSYGMNGLNNATVTARGNCVTQSSGGVAPSITGLNLTLAANTTYYLYLYGERSIPSYGWSYCTGSCTVTYTTYTACGAPTSVSASPGIVVPSGTITVSWSGAKAGTSNSISSYQIYWLVSSNGTAPTTSNYTGTKNVSSTATSGSTTVTLSNATRGYKVVFGVVTRGSAGSSYYSGIKTGGSVTINSKPNAPSISPSTTQTLASTSTGVKVTATPGSDVNTSQTIQVNYTIDTTSGSGTKYTAPVTINPAAGASTTYYFWTYDQLEWSSNTSITVRKNSKPTLSVAITSTSYTYGETAFEIPNQLSITATKGTYGTNTTVSIAIKYGSTEVSVESALSVTSGTAKTYTINPQSILASHYNNTDYNNTGLSYQIIVRYNDGIESANTYTSGSYTIPAAPTVTAKYNQFANTNIGQAGYMCKKVRIYWPEDTSMTSVAVSASGESSGALGTSITTQIINNSRYADVQLLQNPLSNETITLSVSLTNTSGLIKTFSTTMQTIYIPNFGDVSSSSQVISPFEGNISILKTMPWPFGSATTIAAASADAAYCFDLGELKFCVAVDTSATNIKDVAICATTDSPITRDNDNLSASFMAIGNLDGIVSFNKTSDRNYLGLSSTDPTYTGTTSVVGYFKLTNKYGEIFTSQTASFTLNFMRAPQISTTSPFTIAPFNGDSQQLYVQEGLVPKASYKFTYQTEGQYTFTIAQASSANVLVSDTDKANLNWTNIYTNTDAEARILVNNEQSHEITVTNKNLNTSYTEVSNINYRYYRLTISIGSVNQIAYSDAVSVIKHTAPEIAFTGFSAEGDSAAASTTPYTYTITGLRVTNSGAATISGAISISDVNPTGAIYDGSNIIAPWTGSSVVPAAISGTVQNYIWVSHGETPWLRAVRYIQVSTTVTNVAVSGSVYSYTKTFNLAQTGLFISSPTVAYRQNYLGINTKAPAATTTLDIVTAVGRDCIRIVGTNKTILIDTAAGAIALFSGTSATSMSDNPLHIINFSDGTFN